LNITIGFREVFAKQKFGKSQQEISSKSLLYAQTKWEPQCVVVVKRSVTKKLNFHPH